MNATADDQYMQLYCQLPLTDDGMMEGFSDATVVTTTPTPTPTLTPTMMMSSSVSSTPKSSSNSLKPIRRRSSISKRTHPITLLNANTTNFRALVQQFTGCPTPTSTFPLFHKGPITLNFQQGTKQHNIHQHDTTTGPIIMTPFGSNNQAHQVDVPVPPLPLQKQHNLMQEHQSNPCRPGFEVSDGLPMNINDFSLRELTVKNPFSNVLCDENVYEGFNYAVTP